MRKKERIVIIGASDLALSLVEEIRRRPQCRYELAGIVVENDTAEVRGLPCPFLGTVRELPRVIGAVRPTAIVLALAEQRGWFPGDQLVEARVRSDIKVERGATVYERLTGMMAIESLTPTNVLFSKELRPSRRALFFARAWSFAAAAVGLIVSAPLLLAIAAVIKLDSAGPVFFVQQRIGMGHRRFKLIKFRSMRHTEKPTSEWELDNGHRITRVGRWLRKYRLDELPQLINVIRGEMNIVGPRPHPVTNEQLFVLVSRNIPQYGTAIPYYSLRTAIPPGITGWAQVRYRYANGLDEEMEKLRYDLYYLKHYSSWLDLRIVFETIRVMLFPDSNKGSLPAAGEAARAHGGGGPEPADGSSGAGRESPSTPASRGERAWYGGEGRATTPGPPRKRSVHRA